MKETLILITTHRGITDETYESVLASGCPNVLKVKGQAVIDRARSIAFDRAIQAFTQADRVGAALDTLLLVDDDMVFTDEDARNVVVLSRTLQTCVSGVTCNSKGETTHVAYKDGFATGLAFMAIPRALLEQKAETLPTIGGIRAWCHTGLHPDFPQRWIGEDYWFCALMGGVRIDWSAKIGHVKRCILTPGDDGKVKVRFGND